MRIVEITWLDSRGVTSEWQFIEDIEPLEPCTVITVGYLLESNAKYKTVVQSMGEDQLLGRITIPIGCIKKVRTLRK